MWKSLAPALAAAAAPGTALAHHGGPADIAVGIGAGAVAVAIVAGFLAVRTRRARRDGTGADLAEAGRPSIPRFAPARDEVGAKTPSS